MHGDDPGINSEFNTEGHGEPLSNRDTSSPFNAHLRPKGGELMQTRFLVVIYIASSIFGCDSVTPRADVITTPHMPSYLAKNDRRLREPFKQFCDRESLESKGIYFFRLANSIDDAALNQIPITKDALLSMVGVPDLVTTASLYPEHWVYLYVSSDGTAHAWIVDIEYGLVKQGGFNTFKPEYYSASKGWVQPKLSMCTADTIAINQVVLDSSQ